MMRSKSDNPLRHRYVSSTSVLNDRLRKRRCFADKELDQMPVETFVSKSAFRALHPKKWTDFSVATIIGRN